MKKCINLSIGKTSIITEIDPNPDYSFYGEYTDKIGPGVIIREYNEFYEKIPTEMERDYDGRFIGKKEPEWTRYGNEYAGFKPYAGGEKPGSKNYYKYGMRDYERMESYNNQNWWFINITVKTDVISDSGYSDTIYNSLCLVESDSGKDYIKEIIDDLKYENKQELLKRGFREKEIDKSLVNAEEKEEW